MKKNFSFKEISNPSATFVCLNDIQDVIDGKKPTNPENLWMNAGDFSHGLGNGAIESINALGESIIVNGIAYTKSADQASPNYYQMIAGEKFMTSWVFMLSKEARPSYQVTCDKAQGSCSMLDIYDTIHAKVQQPFCVVGIIHCADFSGTAIAKAPIENLNIFEHKNIYYPSQVNEKNVTAVIVGVAADLSADMDPRLKQMLKKVVYYNPLESTPDALTTHEHALVLKNSVNSIEEVTQIMAVDVEHFFTDSKITDFNLNVYLIDDIELK